MLIALLYVEQLLLVRLDGVLVRDVVEVPPVLVPLTVEVRPRDVTPCCHVPNEAPHDTGSHRDTRDGDVLFLCSTSSHVGSELLDLPIQTHVEHRTSILR
ncbi:hypothetical protein D1872_270750 [compost metagenome]